MNKEQIDFSIVIPCYNHGKYLESSISGLLKATHLSCEIIVVDDGSTDPDTITELKQLEDRCTVLYQKNQGPSAARNNAIRHASGRFIVPLDADDTLHITYLEQALPILANDEADIVYANYAYISDHEGTIELRPFNVQELLLNNTIGACAIYKKECWEAAGGYDEQLGRGLGWEDWDYWLNLCANRYRFRHLPITGYSYLIHQNSRERSFATNMGKVNHIITHWEQKYPHLYNPSLVQETIVKQLRNSPVSFMIKLYLISFFPKYFKQLADKGKYKKYIL